MSFLNCHSCDYRMVLTDVWRCTTAEDGVQFVTTDGVLAMETWFAVNSDMNERGLCITILGMDWGQGQFG